MRLPMLQRAHPLRWRLVLTIIRLTSDYTPDILKVIWHRPRYFGAPYSAAAHSALRGPSAWSPGERELFAAFVSKQNACRF
jgi:hypothetical protein